jgi:hypothetical protein
MNETGMPQQGGQMDPTAVLMENNAMLKEIGAMIQQMMGTVNGAIESRPGMQGGAMSEDDALRQEAMARLAAQGQ